MKVCQRLEAEERVEHKFGNPVHFYCCECCGEIHVGHLGGEESILMMNGEGINIRELQGLK